MYRIGLEFVFRVADAAWIPKDESNRDYQEYLAWLAEGNTPLPYVDTEASIASGSARTQRQASRKQAQAAKLAKRGDELGAIKLLVGL